MLEKNKNSFTPPHFSGPIINMTRIKIKKTLGFSPSAKSGAGFTLIELLVVIAIIGLLASVVLVALNGARQKSRVTKRLADIAQIQKALELYYSDNNAYPSSGGTWYTQCAGYGGGWTSFTSNLSGLIPGLSPKYVAAIPADPSMSAAANVSCYIYISNGTDYKFRDQNVLDMSNADFLKYPTYVDPTYDGGPVGGTLSPTSCDGSGDNTNINSFAIYSTVSSTANYRCY